MDKEIKILIYEDNKLDILLIKITLEKAEINFKPVVANNKENYCGAIKNFKPDIILSDYQVPDFDGMMALKYQKEHCPETPFIFVTGYLSEDTAIDCLKDGAWDYVIKNRIKRLPVAIKSALNLKRERLEKKRKDSEIEKSEQRFRRMTENINNGLIIIENSKVKYFNKLAGKLLGKSPEEMNSLNPSEIFTKNEFQEIEKYFKKTDNENIYNGEFDLWLPDETELEKCLLVKFTVSKSGDGDSSLFITLSDVTERRLKNREESLKLKFTTRLIETNNSEELFNSIDKALEEFLNIKNFFIAVFEPTTGFIKLIYNKDEKGLPDSFQAGNTFTSLIINNRKILLLKEKDIRKMIKDERVEYVGEISKVWLGIPFETSKQKGAVVVQDYKSEKRIGKHDLGIFRYITDQIGKQIERKFNLETIQESEYKFRELVENMSSGVAIFKVSDEDKNYVLKDINKSGEKIYACSRHDVLNKNVTEIFPGVSYIGLLDAMRKVDNTGKSEYLPVKFYSDNKINVWIDNYIYKLPNGDIVAVFDNHSERIRAEEMLMESESRYRTLSEITFEGILIHENSILVDCNLSFARLFGYKRHELIGSHVIEKLISPCSHAQILDNIEKNITKPYEVIGVKKNRTLIPLELEAKNLTYLGRPAQVIAFRNITFRKQALEELKLSEEKFNKITNSAHDAIILMDEKGQVSFWNKAAENIFQYKKEEIIGKNLHRVLAPAKFHEAHKAGFQHFLKTGKGKAMGKTLTLEAIRKDGAIIPVELSLSAIRIRDKWNAVGILRDITERKKYESEILNAKQKAEEMNRMKTNFIATISHELRTPLNGIMGFTEILNEYLHEEEYRDMTEAIFISAQRLFITINQIIDLSVIEANKLKIHNKPEKIAMLIDQIQEHHQADAAKKGLDLKINYKVTDVFAKVDKVLFSQALNNLINNAIKYTNIGSVTVELDTVKKNGKDWVSVSVKDTGIGISPKNISMIYDAFRQASEGYNRAFEGTGLGLHITKKYVDFMGGEIDAESELGNGSNFTIYLPQIESPETKKTVVEKLANEKKLAGEQPRSKKPKILIVEDDKQNREVAVFMLQKIYNIDEAVNGPDAIEMTKINKYDLILMDINLGPKMNGLQVIKEIRKLPVYKNIPIAAITANVMVEQIDEFLTQGCTHYISKPYSKKQLLLTVEEMLSYKNH